MSGGSKAELLRRLLEKLHAGNVAGFRENLRAVASSGEFDPNEPVYGKSGDTLLHVIARMGGVETLDAMVEVFGAEKIDLEACNVKESKRPLHEAAQFGHHDVVGRLIDLGIRTERPLDVNCLKRADWSPLMLAAAKPGSNHFNTVRILLDNKGDTVVRNKDGWNAFHLAVRGGDVSIVKEFLRCDPNCWNTVSNNGRTPIHTASLHGRLEVIRVLEGYPSVSRVDSCGITPFADSVKSGNLEAVMYLGMKHPEDILAVDGMGRSPLDIASYIGIPKAVEYLISELNVEPIPNRDTGMNPLHWAALEGHSGVVEMLVEKFSVDPDKADNQGRTPLYLSVSSGKVEATKYLMNRTRTFHMNYLNLNLTQPMKDMLRETFGGWGMKLFLPPATIGDGTNSI